MKITISGTKQELAAFLKDFDNPENVMKMLVTNDAVEKTISYDDPIIAQYFGRVSWATYHLAKVIWENAGTQSNERGLFLTVEQLEKHEIGERTASARVGGSKRVCADLGIDDILFLKWVRGIKYYYVRSDAIPTLMQCLEDDESQKNYKEYLDEISDKD